MRFRKIGRRGILKAGAAGAAILGAPAIIRSGRAAGSIKIGVPTAITGNFAPLGAQVLRACKLVEKTQNAKGGVMGEQIQFLYEDTTGNPANCVRKAQELVERDGCRLFTGIMASSEALAVVPKLEEWNAFFISSINGDGSLTADAFVPNFFRANTSGPMGARTVALYLKDAPAEKFYAIGLDYAWGHNSVAVFEEQIDRIGKEFVGKVFAPTGTKDYSTYIAKIRQSGADGVYFALQGDDGNAFLKQAAQYRLADRMTMVTEIVDLVNIRGAGEASAGLVGGSRYSFTIDTPENQEFVELYKAEYDNVPDTFEGETYQALQILFAAIEKAGSTDTQTLVKTMEDMEVSSVKGRVLMRACDHQGEQEGFVVRVEPSEEYPHPIPAVLTTYPADVVTPPCRKSTYDD